MSMKPRGDWGGTLNPPREPAGPQPPVGLGRNERIAFVSPNFHLAELKQREYRDMPWMKVIWPGTSVVGIPYALIIIDGDTYNEVTKFGTETTKSWWREGVLTRLKLHGQIIIT